MTLVQTNESLFRDDALMFFGVLPDRESYAEVENRHPCRWFLDADGDIRRLYGAETEAGEVRSEWVLIDPTLRIMASAALADGARVFETLKRLPRPDDHAGAPMHAPVLIVPRVFEPALCRRLMEYYHEVGGSTSGVMRVEDGKTVGVFDDFKKRKDATITDEDLMRETRVRILHRLMPEITRAFQFNATRMERYIVACYDAADGGYFNAHRDNTTPGTAHRKFAVSINLNAEEFDGGDLRFPEFGRKTYRPPTGGAVVFSCSLLHEATPVTRGTRYAFLPFLYDEEGARIREQNLASFATAP